MYSRAQLAADFRSLGVAAGDLVMVHASVRAVGEVAGGPDEIHLALKDALTERGTLLMYASCPQYVDEVGRGNLSPAQEAEVLEKLPVFDPDTARSARDNGTLVEFLRTWPGSRVNRHPARFVAWGTRVDDLFSAQPWSYAFGHGSVLEDGTRVWRNMEEFDTSGQGVHANWPERFFARLVDTLLSRHRNTGGRVGVSPVCRARPPSGRAADHGTAGSRSNRRRRVDRPGIILNGGHGQCPRDVSGSRAGR